MPYASIWSFPSNTARFGIIIRQQQPEPSDSLQSTLPYQSGASALRDTLPRQTPEKDRPELEVPVELKGWEQLRQARAESEALSWYTVKWGLVLSPLFLALMAVVAQNIQLPGREEAVRLEDETGGGAPVVSVLPPDPAGRPPQEITLVDPTTLSPATQRMLTGQDDKNAITLQDASQAPNASTGTASAPLPQQTTPQPMPSASPQAGVPGGDATANVTKGWEYGQGVGGIQLKFKTGSGVSEQNVCPEEPFYSNRQNGKKYSAKPLPPSASDLPIKCRVEINNILTGLINNVAFKDRVINVEPVKEFENIIVRSLDELIDKVEALAKTKPNGWLSDNPEKEISYTLYRLSNGRYRIGQLFIVHDWQNIPAHVLEAKKHLLPRRSRESGKDGPIEQPFKRSTPPGQALRTPKDDNNPFRQPNFQFNATTAAPEPTAGHRPDRLTYYQNGYFFQK
ncbi:MAG: hypothetical protein SFZ03_09745 [Candidatus Melainabacteria bacterium]|nr:hypothetical protein [Candidatus Melainabacteria bacterium]